MRPPSPPILGLLAALLALPAVASDDLKSDASAGRKLLTEGDAEADQGRPGEAVLRYKKAFEQLLPGMRKIAFKNEVKRDVTARDALREVIRKEIDEDETAEEFRADELSMKALGLLARDFNLKETMLQVYAEEIAAFYDPKTKTMHLIKESEEKMNRKPGLFERLMGKTGGFDKVENKTVIAHEMTHALADQNYDLAAMQKRTKGDEDRELALSALIEGEATLTMMGASQEDWDGSKTAILPSDGLDRMFSFLMPMMPMASGKALREAPPILSESLLFPYLRGLVFCARLTNDGGWPALDAAYRNPPMSTEQVLHPEKYAANPDVPTAVDLGKIAAPEGWKELTRNVVGEMQLAVLLRKHGGKSAAAGWDGDTYVSFEGPNDRLGLVWFTTWDTEADASEFARNYLRFQTRKVGDGLDEPSGPLDAARRTRADADATYCVDRRGLDVVVVEGFPLKSAGPLVEAAFLAKKSDKVAPPTKPVDATTKGREE